MENKSQKKVLNFFSFIALFIVAVLVVIDHLLPVIQINIGDTLKNILSTIKELLILIVISCSAYTYVQNKSKAWKISFIVCICVFVAGVVITWF